MSVRYQKQWVVRSVSRPNIVYKISLTMDNQYQCSCPRWVYKREDCKHIRSIRDSFRPAEPIVVLPERLTRVVTRQGNMSIWDNGLDVALEDGG